MALENIFKLDKYKVVVSRGSPVQHNIHAYTLFIINGSGSTKWLFITYNIGR